MGLYIQLHSMHGLIRAKDLELGRDEDTGGQITYVIELAKALSRFKTVERVDIVTRLIKDEKYPGYSKPSELIPHTWKKARIIRLECGPEKYLKKVDLWPHLDEFVENNKKFYKKIRRKPDIIHSHYADSGLVGTKLSQELHIPLVHTGHSLGIPKMKRLGITKNNRAKFEELYHFKERFDAENKTIAQAKIITTSTKEEIEQQYKGYKVRSYDKFKVNPPGIDIRKFHPNRRTVSKRDQKSRTLFRNILYQNLKDQDKKLIVVMSRLDKRKNITTLVQAYAENKKLRKIANLVVFAPTLFGNNEAQKVINSINRLIKKYDLFDSVALPGIFLSYEEQVPALYRFLHYKKGVFCNPALIEPFGLTLLEAQACGVPVAATKNGGPSEFVLENENGVLFNPRNTKEISEKIYYLLEKNDYNAMSIFCRKYIQDNYTWKKSALRYIKIYKKILKEEKQVKKENKTNNKKKVKAKKNTKTKKINKANNTKTKKYRKTRTKNKK